MGIRIAIDASRARSGGARSHIIGVLRVLNISHFEIEEIHVWSYSDLLKELPTTSWLIKHESIFLEKSLFYQIFWQSTIFNIEIKKVKCNILLTLDGSSFCSFSPQVVMSRDLLSYEPGIRQLYGFSLSRLRIEVIKILQNLSFKRAQGVVFLTKYSQKLITNSCGDIRNSIIIPHGFNEAFLNTSQNRDFEATSSFYCVYVSNAEFYKHHIEVINAISIIRKKGIDIKLKIIGGGQGKYYNSVLKEIKSLDPNNEYLFIEDFLPNSDLPILISKADLFIFASGCEAFGITLLEGMATGIPVICSNKSSLPELIDNTTLLFDPTNVSSIVSAISEMYSNPLKRATCSSATFRRSQDFSWSKCSRELFSYILTVYESYNNK